MRTQLSVHLSLETALVLQALRFVGIAIVRIIVIIIFAFVVIVAALTASSLFILNAMTSVVKVFLGIVQKSMHKHYAKRR